MSVKPKEDIAPYSVVCLHCGSEDIEKKPAVTHFYTCDSCNQLSKEVKEITFDYFCRNCLKLSRHRVY